MIVSVLQLGAERQQRPAALRAMWPHADPGQDLPGGAQGVKVSREWSGRATLKCSTLG